MALGTVKTACGLIEGEEYGGDYSGVTVFRGIPYAAPSVGNLWFVPPEDPACWEGVRECTQFAPAAVQTPLSGRHAKEYYYDSFPEMSEDRLYLSVCSGAQAAGGKRSMYLWFHGGGLTNCYSYEKQFNPQVLAKKGIVVVTVGQRLNLFGYLVLPQLDKEQNGKSGNYGFMDQLEVLEWVVSNISAFGGDPDCITAGGQSGGCLKAAMLTASPAGKRRIRRVISHSGLKWMIPFKSREEAAETSKKYLAHIGLPKDISPEELRSLPMEQLYSMTAGRAIMPGDMVSDGDLVPYETVVECFEHFLGQVDFLNSYNLGEVQMGEIRSADVFYRHFRELLGTLYDAYDFEQLVQVEDEEAWLMSQELAVLGLAKREGTNVSRNLMSNQMFGRYMGAHAPDSHVYNGLWTHRIPLTGEDLGSERDCDMALARHSAELWFTFASLREGVPPDRPWRGVGVKMARLLSSYWANFIRSGNPNGVGLLFWPESAKDYGYLELGEEMNAHQGIHNRLDELIHAFVQREYRLDL